MWPWDGGQSTPANIGPGDVLSLLPHFAPRDIVKPKDTLNIKRYGYTYDTIQRTRIISIGSREWLNQRLKNFF
ncbi:tyrosinase [Anabaena cylindrica PCC 7122]|uniref:Tyrosinase n=1 Tax=Anabaena cylindrica (strain ATCC 27899 / PCC 7122) TaxID=272123 RepID=K9ZE02_ANACC|nr:tyrosinase [Anabaena cylindrica PCC 7122]BAY06249.1 tyrosinase [Anabaena cylindrica PCC 7122]